MIVIAILVVVAVVAVLFLGFLLFWIDQFRTGRAWFTWFRRRRPPFSFQDGRITTTKDRLYVGEKCDIRLHFTVANPTRENLTYDARLSVEGHPDVQQNNTFSQDRFGTVVPRFSASWQTTGVKKVKGAVTVASAWGASVRAEAEGTVHVVAETEEAETDH